MVQLILHSFMILIIFRSQKLLTGNWAGWHFYLFIWLLMFFCFIDCYARNFWLCSRFNDISSRFGLYIIIYLISIVFFIAFLVIVSKFFFYPVEYWWCYFYNHWNFLIHILNLQYRYNINIRLLYFYLIWYYSQLFKVIDLNVSNVLFTLIGMSILFYIYACFYLVIKWHNNMYFVWCGKYVSVCCITFISMLAYSLVICFILFIFFFYMHYYRSNNRGMGGYIYYFYYFYYFTKVARWDLILCRYNYEYNMLRIMSVNWLILSFVFSSIYNSNIDSYIFYYNYYSWIIYLFKLIFFKTWKYAWLLTPRYTELNTLYLVNIRDNIG